MGVSFPEGFWTRDSEEIFKSAKAKAEREFAENSRKLDDLLVSETFNVESVFGESHSTEITPWIERVMGGSSPVYKTGFTIVTGIRVAPVNSGVPVALITFNGYTPVRAGDLIVAKIPRFEIVRHPFVNERRRYFTDRAYKEEEKAIQIDIMDASSKDRILRTDRAVDYKSIHWVEREETEFGLS